MGHKRSALSNWSGRTQQTLQRSRRVMARAASASPSRHHAPACLTSHGICYCRLLGGFQLHRTARQVMRRAPPIQPGASFCAALHLSLPSRRRRRRRHRCCCCCCCYCRFQLQWLSLRRSLWPRGFGDTQDSSRGSTPARKFRFRRTSPGGTPRKMTRSTPPRTLLSSADLHRHRPSSVPLFGSGDNSPTPYSSSAPTIGR